MSQTRVTLSLVTTQVYWPTYCTLRNTNNSNKSMIKHLEVSGNKKKLEAAMTKKYFVLLIIQRLTMIIGYTVVNDYN